MSNEIDKIIADERVLMTDTLIRAFRAEGCDPACHCCLEKILNGQHFKLAVVEDNDEMLCCKCTPKKLIKKRKRADRRSVIGLDKSVEKVFTPTTYRAAGYGFTRKNTKSA